MAKQAVINTISATNLRKDTSNILGQVKHAKTTIVIEMHGKPCALLTPLNEFGAENTLLLSERDTQTFLDDLENPPKPNQKLLKAMKKYLKRHT